MNQIDKTLWHFLFICKDCTHKHGVVDGAHSAEGERLRHDTRQIGMHCGTVMALVTCQQPAWAATAQLIQHCVECS
jgi:hypothetical protein